MWGPLLVLLVAAAPAPPLAQDFEGCDALIEEDPRSWRGWSCIYRIARSQSRFDEARVRLESFQQRYPDNAQLLRYYSSVLNALGDDKGVELTARVADMLAEQGDRDGEARQRLNLAYLGVRHDLDLPDQYPRALDAAYLSGNPELIALTQLSYARRLEREDMTAATSLAWMRRIEPFAVRSRHSILRISWYSNWAIMMGHLNRNLEVVDAERELIAIARETNDRDVIDFSVMQLALRIANDPQLRAAVDPAELDALAQEGLEIGQTTQLRRANAFLECLRGALEPDATRAASHYTACHQECIEAGETLREVEAGVWLAAAVGLSDPARALDIVQRQSVRRVELDGESPNENFVRTQLRFRLGDSRAPDDAVALLERLGMDLQRESDPLLRAGMIARWLPYVYDLAGRLLDTGDTEAALDLVERLRARSLIEGMEESGISPLSTASAAAREGYDGAARALGEAQRKLQDGDVEGEERATLIERLRVLEGEETAAWASLLLETAGAKELYQPPALDFDRIRAALGPDQALLSFQLGEPLPLPAWWTQRPPSWLLVLTRDAQLVLPLPTRAEIDPLVDLLAGAFEQRDGSEVPLSVALYDKLLRDAVDDLPDGVRNVVIVPDGQLHRLPFAALRPDAEAEPIGTRLALTTAPSVRVWLRQKAIPARKGGTIVFADPAILGARDVADERGWLLATGNRLGRLPLAQQEAAAVRQHLGPAVDVRIGYEATESLVKAGAFTDHGVIHIAAHALVDEQWPERSAILLAPGTPGEDGMLRLREIATLDFSGAVVVLAACESASGLVVGGEGPFGLARAFFAGRARAVVASLWKLRDDEALAFFDAFYRHLGAGASIAAAVRDARADRWRAGADAAGWAGIVVVGDGDLVPHPIRASSTDPRLKLVLVIAGILGIIILGLGGDPRPRPSE